MAAKTYRVVSLQVFLHCTLGGFCEAGRTERDLRDQTIARMYRAGRLISEIMRAAECSQPQLYKRVHAMGIEMRRPVNPECNKAA